MISNDDEWRDFYKGISHAPDHKIREWATLIAAVWGAWTPTDPAQQSADTRDNRSHGAALNIIEDFRLRQSLGVEQSPETLRWLAEALGRVVEHKDLDPLHSLGLLPRPRKRPPDPQLGEDVAFWIECAGRRGYSESEAKDLAATVYAKDPRSIDRYLQRAVGWTPASDESAERYFMHKGKPLPEPKDKK